LRVDKSIEWEIEIKIFRNKTVLGEILKVLLIASAVPGLLVFILWAVEGFPRIIDMYNGKYLVSLLIVLILGTILYLFLTMNKYPVKYQLNPKGVTFITLPKQRRKNKITSSLLVIIGALNKSPVPIGTGMMLESHQDMHTDWRKVEKIVFDKERKSITLRCKDVTKNVLFCNEDNVDEIFEIILYYCPKAKILIKTKSRGEDN